jgi:RimJ/RimL family protein N-acetyltransferase
MVDYFLQSSPEYLEGMGIDPSKCPARESWIESAWADHFKPIAQRDRVYLAWIFAGRLVGHSSINKIVPELEASIHLHLWRPELRNRRMGASFFIRSANYFLKQFKFKKVYCEPYAGNPSPNSVLTRIGFEFVRRYRTIPGPSAFEQDVNRYELNHEIGLEIELQPTLSGDLIEARPLRVDDFEAMYAAASDPLIWQQHPEPDRYQRDVFRNFFDGALQSGGAFAVVERKTGRIIGSSRYCYLDPPEREVEIGYTFLERAYWGGSYNGELKALMLKHAFRYVDRVLFVVGEQNVRSQTALLRIGAKLQEHRSMPFPDGTMHPSVIFAISRWDDLLMGSDSAAPNALPI